MAARTRHHRAGGFKQQTFIVSQLWWPGVQNQGVGATLPLRLQGDPVASGGGIRETRWPLVVAAGRPGGLWWWHQGDLGASAGGIIQCSLAGSCLSTVRGRSPPCVSVCPSSSCKDSSLAGLGATLLLVFTNDICCSPISDNLTFCAGG